MAVSEETLTLLDVGGLIGGYDKLLAAAEKVGEAGQRLSHGLGLLQVAPAAVNDGDNNWSLVDVLRGVQADFKAADESLAQAEQSLAGVHIGLMPASLRGPATQLDELVPLARLGINEYLSRAELLLTMAGANHERDYLLVFQNNHELRPTGGFIGSLALVNVDRGVVENIDVQSVYDSDGQLKEFIDPPRPLQNIVNRWYLRDANWFVDWRQSARKITHFFEKEGGPTVDGVIAFTPAVIERLLTVSGPLHVPGYDDQITAENFFTVAQNQVTYSYDREENRPKQFFADLIPVLLNKLFSGGEVSALALAEVIGQSVTAKDLLFYLRDPAEHTIVHEAGGDGAFPEQAQGMLAVNTANIGGHKSDQFIEQEIDYRSRVLLNGDVDVVVTIRRTHLGPSEKLDLPYPPDEDPAAKDNIVYQRVLVPAGAQLLEAQGFTDASRIQRFVEPEKFAGSKPDIDVAQLEESESQHDSGTIVGSEAGFTFFANWLVTEPGSTSVGVYHYRLPKHASLPNILNPAETYATFVVKQPGDDRTSIRVEVVLPKESSIVHTVPNEGITYKDERTIVYRGKLNRDITVGAVYESR